MYSFSSICSICLGGQQRRLQQPPHSVPTMKSKMMLMIAPTSVPRYAVAKSHTVSAAAHTALVGSDLDPSSSSQPGYSNPGLYASSSPLPKFVKLPTTSNNPVTTTANDCGP